MKQVLTTSKKIGFAALALVALGLAILVCLERLIAWRTPSLTMLAHRIREADVSMTFVYDSAIQRNLHQIATEFGVSQFVDDWLGHLTDESQSLEKGIGAKGFLFAGLQPQNGVLMIKRLDHFLDNYLKGVDQIEATDDTESALNEESEYEEDIEDDELESTVAIPLQQALETMWNSGFLTVGGAIELDMNFVDRLHLGASFLLARDEAFLRSLAVHSMPLTLQQAFVEEVFDRSTFRVDKEKKSGIYFGNLDLDGDALESLFDTLCPEETNGFDACSYLAPSTRELVLQHMATLINLLNDEFEASLHFHWILQGKTLVFSNRASVLKSMLGSSDTKFSSDTPLIEPALATLTNPLQGLVSVGANLARIQDNTLTLLAMLRMEQRRQSLRSQDLLATPQTEEALSSFEESVLNLSTQFKKATFGAGIYQTSLTPLLWAQTGVQNQSEVRINSENLLVSGLGRLLYPQSKNISRSLIPVEQIESTILEPDDFILTRATLSAPQLSPIVQRRFRNLPNPSRSEL